MRKHDVNNINLEVDNLEVWNCNDCDVIRITWSSDIGFGQYELSKKDGEDWVGYSETMDSNDDKDFIRKLMELIIDKLKIVD